MKSATVEVLHHVLQRANVARLSPHRARTLSELERCRQLAELLVTTGASINNRIHNAHLQVEPIDLQPLHAIVQRFEEIEARIARAAA